MTLQELNRKKKRLLNHQKNLRADMGTILWRNWINLPESIKEQAIDIAIAYQIAIHTDYPALQQQILTLLKENKNG